MGTSSCMIAIYLIVSPAASNPRRTTRPSISEPYIQKDTRKHQQNASLVNLSSHRDLRGRGISRSSQQGHHQILHINRAAALLRHCELHHITRQRNVDRRTSQHRKTLHPSENRPHRCHAPQRGRGLQKNDVEDRCCPEAAYCRQRVRLGVPCRRDGTAAVESARHVCTAVPE